MCMYIGYYNIILLHLPLLSSTQVDRINLHYAKRPKKVDFKRLKRNMWNLITDLQSDKVVA